ncbi:hypothetical protein [Actinoplanes aureus]|uniref:Uncharacterized protein n=1 Tax=Actinoplanes aureus TaxID=2792083 RepID=A0A931G1Q8_9ACTN|nr:hypothetical protein [Actinoplanes aureus]MBG0568183.1 hypothetical protein [Actinoplanes aureus]
MTLGRRLRLAIILGFFSVLPLAAVILGAVAFWDNWSGARQAMTIFLAVMFTICVGVSISIAADKRLEGVPWLRIGTIGLFIVLACGVGWVREMV